MMRLATIVAMFAAWAALADPMLEQAVSTYDEALATEDTALRLERFRRSARLFRQVINETQTANADLQANLGNAALQCEQLGDAILAYRRALAIEPGHARAQRNLVQARRLLPESVPRPQTDTLFDTFFTWHRTLSRGRRATAAAICFLLTCMLLAVAIRWRRTWARYTALLPAAAWLALMGLTLWKQPNGAVIVAPEVIVRAADSTGAPPRFAEPLPSGVEVNVIAQRGDWSRIELANGRDGWVRSSAIETVAP